MVALIAIDDPSDPRVASYVNIRDRDLKGGHGGRFIAEGESVLKLLLSPGCRFEVESLLIAENRIEALAEFFESLHGPVYVAARTVMDAIVGFPIHRGLLGSGRRGVAMAPDRLLKEKPRLLVALAGISNHDNMGGLFRNAAAFGAGAVLLDRECCDPLYRKAIRVSVGGVLKVPFATAGRASDMVHMLKNAGYRVLALSPRGEKPLHEIETDRPTALLLGSEGPGLSADVIALAESVRIEMPGGFDSLNVATTSGIALYELAKQDFR